MWDTILALADVLLQADKEAAHLAAQRVADEPPKEHSQPAGAAVKSRSAALRAGPPGQLARAGAYAQVHESAATLKSLHRRHTNAYVHVDRC